MQISSQLLISSMFSRGGPRGRKSQVPVKDSEQLFNIAMLSVEKLNDHCSDPQREKFKMDL